MSSTNKLVNCLLLFVPLYGGEVRFRLCLRLREFFRVHKMFLCAKCLKSYLIKRYGCEISINAVVSPKAQFMHSVGVIIGDGVVVSPGVKLYGNLTLGRKNILKEDDYPYIGENVTLSTGCAVLGKVRVAANTVVGSHSLLLSSTEENSMYVGIPAARIK